MNLLLTTRQFIRNFAERPSSKKAVALKKLQNETKDLNAPAVEVKLPAVGSAMKNLNISVGGVDPIVLPDSEYPDWIWSARGPCRAILRSQPSISKASKASETAEHEKIAQLKKLIRAENRNIIRRNNRMLKGSSQ